MHTLCPVYNPRQSVVYRSLATLERQGLKECWLDVLDQEWEKRGKTSKPTLLIQSQIEKKQALDDMLDSLGRRSRVRHTNTVCASWRAEGVHQCLPFSSPFFSPSFSNVHIHTSLALLFHNSANCHSKPPGETSARILKLCGITTNVWTQIVLHWQCLFS